MKQQSLRLSVLLLVSNTVIGMNTDKFKAFAQRLDQQKILHQAAVAGDKECIAESIS